MEALTEKHVKDFCLGNHTMISCPCVATKYEIGHTVISCERTPQNKAIAVASDSRKACNGRDGTVNIRGHVSAKSSFL